MCHFAELTTKKCKCIVSKKKINNMTLQNLIAQLGLTDREVEDFAEKMTTGSSLKALCKLLDQKIDEKKAFLFAKIYCQSILGMNIEDVAPALVDERDKILKRDERRLIQEKMVKSHLKVFRQIEEDLALYLMERKGKNPAI